MSCERVAMPENRSVAMPPRISILLPAFNAERTLLPCLRSIQRQTERRWECVLVDDGSTDGTLDLARGMARGDERFRIIATAHGGLVSALNAGLSHCVGEYVARMDADDLMRRDRLERQAALLDKDRSLAAAGCHVRFFPRAGLGDGARRYEQWLNGIESASQVRREAFIECPVAHPSLMLRRECIADAGYRDQGWPEDYDLILRMLSRGLAVGVLPRRLLCWRDHPHRLWRTAEPYRLDRFTACKATFLSETFLAGSDLYILWGHGATGRALRRALVERGKRPSHIVEVHPRRLGNRIAGAPVIAPHDLPNVTRRPLLVSVAGAGPRRQIRDALTAMGFRETHDYFCTA